MSVTTSPSPCMQLKSRPHRFARYLFCWVKTLLGKSFVRRDKSHAGLGDVRNCCSCTGLGGEPFSLVLSVSLYALLIYFYRGVFLLFVVASLSLTVGCCYLGFCQ